MVVRTRRSAAAQRRALSLVVSVMYYKYHPTLLTDVVCGDMKTLAATGYALRRREMNANSKLRRRSDLYRLELLRCDWGRIGYDR